MAETKLVVTRTTWGWTAIRTSDRMQIAVGVGTPIPYQCPKAQERQYRKYNRFTVEWSR
jgi:hypothetical protein